MKALVFTCLVLLIPATVIALDFSWKTMDGPYYISNVTGISIGYQNGQTYAYAVGSDGQHKYPYSYQGNSPIGDWARNLDPIDGLTYISASRNDGRYAYASVPVSDPQVGTPGVCRTTNSGTSWPRTSSQPGNLLFTGIAVHPNAGNVCLTASTYSAGLSTIYKTENSGTDWVPITPPNANDCRALYIDPNSPGNLAATTLFACFKDNGNVRGGLYRSTNGGSTWQSRFDLYGDGIGYNAICVVVKDGYSNHICAVTWRQDDDYPMHYMLWYTFNNGASWGSVDAGDERVFWIDIQDNQGRDLITALTSTVMREGYADSTFDSYFVNGPNMQILSACRDINDPYSAVITGQDYAIYKFYEEFDNFANIELTKGSNIMDVASIDFVEGSSLRAIGREGGFIGENLNVVPFGDYGQEWGTEDCLLRYNPANPELAEGGKIRGYITNGSLSFVASGTEGIDNAIAIVDGQRVDESQNENPIYIGAITGERLVAGTNSNNEDVVWNVSDTSYREDANLGITPFTFKGLTKERCAGHSQEYYFCGDRGNGLNLAAFAYGPRLRSVLWLNGGLGSVTKANCIIKSNEQHLFNPEIEPALYLATEDGVFKTKYDFINVQNWYPVNFGIGANYEIKDLANYNEIVMDTTYRPDSLVQYALASDAGSNSYIYISADSGRSWNEIGAYFRFYNIHANDLSTFIDKRSGIESNLYLAAGTDNGVYRYPYNVISGVISEDDTLGPGTVFINGDVAIDMGVTLTIAPGTTIKALYNFDRLQMGSSNSLSEIIVYGNLVANDPNNQTSPVIFESSHPTTPAAGQWYGIRAELGGLVDLKYCQIRNACYALKATSSATITVEHCLIENNLTAGVYLTYSPPTSKITYSTIRNSGTYGIFSKGDSITVSYNTISNNRFGVLVQSDAKAVIDHCLITFTNTPNNSYTGISVSKINSASQAQILSDSIYGFYESGIYMAGANSSSRILNSRAVSCTSRGIYLKGSSPTIGSSILLPQYNLCRNSAIGIELYPVFRELRFPKQNSTKS
jgi:hypothetical protein